MPSSFLKTEIVETTLGRDKSMPIAALRQAKIYPAGKLRPPESMLGSWIAAAAIQELPQSTRGNVVCRVLRLPVCGCRNPRAELHSLWIAATRALRQCRKRRWCGAIRALLEGWISVIRASCNYPTRNANFKICFSDIQLKSVLFLISHYLYPS